MLDTVEMLCFRLRMSFLHWYDLRTGRNIAELFSIWLFSILLNAWWLITEWRHSKINFVLRYLLHGDFVMCTDPLRIVNMGLIWKVHSCLIFDLPTFYWAESLSNWSIDLWCKTTTYLSNESDIMKILSVFWKMKACEVY